MKRIFFLVLFCCLCVVCPTKVQAGNYGVVGGVSLLGVKNADFKSATGYHAGVTYKFRLPVGFAIQPSLLYHAKVSRSDMSAVNAELNVGYLELPVSFQWGPDLLLFRPFLDISPFIGYGLNHDMSFQSYDEPQTILVKDSWSKISRFEYGLGLGGGIEVWKFQFVCRYNWNFGSLLNKDGKIDGQSLLTKTVGNNNFGGVTLSLALLF